MLRRTRLKESYYRKDMPGSRRRMNESSRGYDLCIIYRDNIGPVCCKIDEDYGISFDGSRAYFDVIREDGTTETMKIPVSAIDYIGDPSKWG